MQLPFELIEAIERLSEGYQFSELQAAADRLSEGYRSGGSSNRPFQDPVQMIAYLTTRAPATFAAVHAVLTAVRERIPGQIGKRLLDLGAGPGTASWAALEVFPELEHICLIDGSAAAIEVGQKLSACAGRALQKAEWRCRSLEAEEELPFADLAILSYVLGELRENSTLLKRLIRAKIPLIALIEPGTPQGFERIRAIRQEALQMGATIIAPCPHALACPMQGTNWCHFPARVERTRLMRQLKGGTLGYEDEKFSYVVLANQTIALEPLEGRVVRAPQALKGHVRLPLCAEDGQLREVVVTRKDKERYRLARDAEWGSAWRM